MAKNITQEANGQQRFQSDELLALEFGGSLVNWSLVFETYGQLNEAKDNVVLVHHALSTSSHVASHSQNPDKGWWETMVGPGCPIDTDNYFVICINNLGSCFGTTGPTSINPKTNKLYGPDFPKVSLRDIARSQFQLLQHLSIERVFAVIAASMGAMISLEFAVTYPQIVQKLVLISSCYKAYPSNCANRAIQRDIIRLDPAWADGHYSKNPQLGFKIARKIGHLYYRNTTELNQRFADDNEQVKSYLEYNATKFISKFDANSYLCLLNAMDTFNIARGYNNLEQALGRILAEVMVISVSSDILFPAAQQYAMVKAMQQAGVNVESIAYECTYGHDSFLVDTQGMGRYIKAFLTKQ